MKQWIDLALSLGFTAAAEVDPALLEPRQEVRDMCAEDKCHAYGKNWTCPPNCGTVEECAARIAGKKRGVLLQTTAHLEDSFDIEGMMEAEESHRKNFNAIVDKAKAADPDALCLGTGGCRICGKCAWPEPCRFPEKACASVEGYGLVVSDVCKCAGLPYFYGQDTLTYTACILFSKEI